MLWRALWLLCVPRRPAGPGAAPEAWVWLVSARPGPQLGLGGSLMHVGESLTCKGPGTWGHGVECQEQGQPCQGCSAGTGTSEPVPTAPPPCPVPVPLAENKDSVSVAGAGTGPRPALCSEGAASPAQRTRGRVSLPFHRAGHRGQGRRRVPGPSAAGPPPAHPPACPASPTPPPGAIAVTVGGCVGPGAHGVTWCPARSLAALPQPGQEGGLG